MLADPRVDVLQHFGERAALRVGLHRDHALAIEVVDARRPDAGGDLGHLPERHRDTAAVRPVHEQRQRGQVTDALARLGRQPHVDVARLARRIDPVAGVEAGKRHAQRLRHLADADADGARQAAVDRDFELRLLPAGRQPHVDRAWHLRHLGPHDLGQPVQLAAVGALQLQLDLLLVLEVAAADRRGHAAQLHQLRAQPGLDRLLMPLRARASASAGRRRCPSSTASVRPPMVV